MLRGTQLAALVTLTLACCLPNVATAWMQEAVRNLDQAGAAAKYLSPGETDSWVFQGKQNETVVVRVATSEFDPVIGLARVDDNSEEILFEVDDDGSTSQFSHRLRASATYKIRVHGFEMKGGGNYEMRVSRYPGQPIQLGQQITGVFDRTGQANFYLNCKRDDALVIDRTGTRRDYVQDTKGNTLKYNWHTSVLIEQDGEHLVSLQGRRGHRYTLQIRPAARTRLKLDQKQTVDTAKRGLNIWEIDAQPGQLRYLTVTRSYDVESRLLYAPRENNKDKLLDEERGFQEIQLLPVSSKGDVTRYVAVFGHKGRYQLQSFSHAPCSVTVSMTDPTSSVSRGETVSQAIPIGGSHLFGFEAKAGDMIEAKLDSTDFDGWLRLFDDRGQLVSENDDSLDTKNSHVTHMITRNGWYRWQVSSLGHGGGGDYQLSFNEIKLKQLEIGSRLTSSRPSGTTEYWSLTGEKGRQIYINVHSDEFNPMVAIYGPDGHRYQQDDDSGVGNDALLAIALPTDGRFTIWVSSHRDGGKYDIRILDAQWRAP